MSFLDDLLDFADPLRKDDRVLVRQVSFLGKAQELALVGAHCQFDPLRA